MIGYKKCIKKVSNTINRLKTQRVKYGEILQNLVTFLYKVILIVISLIIAFYSDNLCLLKDQLLEMSYLIWTVHLFANLFSLQIGSMFDVSI